METYYRSMNNLYTYPELGILQTEPSDEFSEEFLRGEGENYGIEWTLHKTGKQTLEDGSIILWPGLIVDLQRRNF